MLKSEKRIHFNKHIENFKIFSGFPIDQVIIDNIGPLVKMGGGGWLYWYRTYFKSVLLGIKDFFEGTV